MNTFIEYCRAFGFLNYSKRRLIRIFRSLFRICPDCDKPLWWKPENHNGCIPF